MTEPSIYDGTGNGDAMHVSKMIPDRPGLQVFQCHENNPYGTTLRDAGTGEILWRQTAGSDTGRCCAAHVDSRYPGYQMWSVATDGTYNATDKVRISGNNRTGAISGLVDGRSAARNTGCSGQ
jgi:hypothetical protein